MRGDRPIEDAIQLGRRSLPRMRGDRPCFFTVSKFSSRLPRMRGDRPTEPIEWFRLIVFTPHTRGQIAVRRV